MTFLNRLYFIIKQQKGNLKGGGKQKENLENDWYGFHKPALVPILMTSFS